MASIISAGTTSGTALNMAGDTSGILQLATNGSTTAITIDTSQRAAFVAGTAALPAITTTGDTNTGMFFPAADTIAFAEGGAESMRIDSSGNVTVGTTATTYNYQTKNIVLYDGTSSGISVASGTKILTLTSQASAGCFVGTRSNDELKFVTNDTERVRMDTIGTLLVGQTSKSVAGIDANVQGTGFLALGSGAGLAFQNRSGTITNTSNWYMWYATSATIYLWNNNNIASINTSTGAYTALSDANKKKDFEESTIGLDAAMQLKPTLYRMKDAEETSTKELGFIAQEVKNVVPQAYVETKSDDADGNESTFIGLNDRAILAVAVKAIQEQQVIIESLKTDIAELKAKVGK